MWGYGYGMGWVWLVVGLLVLVGIVTVSLALVFSWRNPRGDDSPVIGGGGTSAARRILDERYARGEIDTPEYHERRDKLEDR